MSLFFYPFPSFFWILSQSIATEAKTRGDRKDALPGDEQCQYVVSQVSYWLSERNFSSCLLVFFQIAENIKSQVLGKWKKKTVPSLFANVEKYIIPHFFYSLFFAKVPEKGEGRKDFHREPNFWATAVLPSQVPLFFTPRCRDPSSDGRAVSRQCTAAFTYYSPYGRFLLHRWNSPGIQTVKLTWCYLVSTKLVQRTRDSAAA